MDEISDTGSPVSDSGYDTAQRSSCEPPGELEERPEFVLQARVVFVTYSRSRVNDKEQFYQYLQDSFQLNLPWVSPSESATVEIFGSKELHNDGVPHYHVVLRFSKKVHWRKARERLAVWIDLDGERVVDTHSVYIRRKRARESHEKWLQDVQSYVAKDGDVFGQWIGDQVPVAAQKDKYLEQIVETESREEAETLLKKHYRTWWVRNHHSCQAFLKSKKPPAPRLYVPDFEVLPWRVPLRMKQWRERNFPVRGGGRPTSLVIIGPARCGKTYWAQSFGTPAMMDGRWDMDQLLQSGITHVVLNGVDLKTFPNKRELAGCQVSITITGKYRPEMTIPWGKPAIWTCNEENSVLKDKELGPYLKQSGAVIVRLREKMYIEDS